MRKCGVQKYLVHKSGGMTLTLMSGCDRNNAVGKDVLCVVVFEACTPNWVHPKSFI